jgi:hypothetical protein
MNKYNLLFLILIVGFSTMGAGGCSGSKGGGCGAGDGNTNTSAASEQTH